MNKKILSATLAGALAVTAVVGGSLAYFTDTDAKDNTFTVGNVDITLTEPHWNGDDAQNVYAGQKLGKDPIVTNDGNNPCFVRIKVTGLDSLGKDEMITYLTGGEEGALGAGWRDGGDGYFYYDSLLNVDEETTALFDQIKIPDTLTNEGGTEHVGENTVTVTAEAVQAQGARDTLEEVQAMELADIIAWFDKSVDAE